MEIDRRGILRTALAGFAGLSGLRTAQAQTYPARTVTFTVGFGPGGPSDISARFLQRHFKEMTGRDLVIQNRPGAGGATSWSQLNGQPADGYNITLVALPHVVLQPILTPGVGFKFEDINTVLIYTSVPQVIAVPASSPFHSLPDLVAAAKARPGQVTIAGTGVGGSNHSAWYLFNQAAGVKTTYVPFRDTASTTTALMGGQVAAAWTWSTQGIEDGPRIRMLGLAAERRMSFFPDLPTMAEQGVAMQDQAWWGIAVPRATPDSTRREVSETFGRVMRQPGIEEDMVKSGYVPFVVPCEEVPAFNRRVHDLYAPVARAIAT